MLFEQLLPEWLLGEATEDEAGGGGADMAVSKRGARIVAAALFGLMLLFVFAPTALAAVYWGQSGETVRRVQQKLKQWGYYSGAVDGVFGQGTYDAVIRFQKKNGLRADGVAGAATLAAMGVSEKGGGLGGDDGGFRLRLGGRAAGAADSRRGARRALCRHGGGRRGGAQPGQEQPFSQYAGRGDLSIRRV